MNTTTLKIAFAYMGIIIGGGFASGLEIIQFFSSFGPISLAGTLVATLLFAFVGMQVAQLGSQVHATSHKDLLSLIFGRHLGIVIDLLLTFFLFGVGVAMLAGSGAMFKQLLDIEPFYGSLLMTFMVGLTLCLNTQRVVDVISWLTPGLIVVILAIAAYSLFTAEPDMAVLEAAAAQREPAAPHWLLSAVLYAAFNISVGFPMLAVIGGQAPSAAQAGKGGILGGLGLGAMILLLNLCMFLNLDQLAGIEMPTLLLASNISPVLGWLMALAILAMIYNTAVAMFYGFTARFLPAETTRFRLGGAVFCATGFGLSFVGFTQLISTVYPMLGYVGLALIVAVVVSWLRLRKPRRAA